MVEGELVWSVTMRDPSSISHLALEVVWWGTLPTSAFNVSVKSGGEARKSNGNINMERTNSLHKFDMVLNRV